MCVSLKFTFCGLPAHVMRSCVCIVTKVPERYQSRRRFLGIKQILVNLQNKHQELCVCLR